MASRPAETIRDQLDTVIGGAGLSGFRQTIYRVIGGWTEGNENIYRHIGEWSARFRMDAEGRLQVMTRFGENGTPSRWLTVGHGPKEL